MGVELSWAEQGMLGDRLGNEYWDDVMTNDGKSVSIANGVD